MFKCVLWIKYANSLPTTFSHRAFMEQRHKKEDENFFLFQQKYKNTPVGLSLVDILDMFRYSRADVEEMVSKMIEKRKTWSSCKMLSLFDRWSTKKEKEKVRPVSFNAMFLREKSIGELETFDVLLHINLHSYFMLKTSRWLASFSF